MEDKLPEVIGLFRCESEGDIKWSDDLTNSLAVYTRTPAKQSTPEEVREAVEAAQDTLEYWREELKSGDWAVDNCAPAFKFKHLETLIHHATRADGGDRNQQLKYEVKGGVVNISIGVDLLIHAVTHSPMWYDDWVLTDKDLFVEAIVEAMQEEAEDGSQPIHLVFDGAAEKAMEYGTSIDPNTFSTENVKGGA